MTHQRIGDLLVEAGLVKRDDVEHAALRADERGERIGEALMALGLIDDQDLYRQLAAQHHIEFTVADRLFDEIDAELAQAVPHSFQDRKHVIPIMKRDTTLIVASSEPEPRVMDLLDAYKCELVEVKLVTPTDFRRLQWALDLGRVGPRHTDEKTPARPDLLARDLRMEPAHVSLVDAMLADAIGDRASDIHLEQYGGHVRLRLRIDGDLLDVDRYRMTPAQLNGVINVFKVRSNLDIAERRRPQGGRFATRVGGHDFDFRVQTQPTLHGEHLVIRLLPQERNVFSTASLGFSEGVRHAYDRVLASPAGLVLVVGPTGSGKSTTLYAGLQTLALQKTRKVITVEDPIEYAIDGIQQSEARPDLGFSFAEAMRTFVREDPDVIFVGEIRDPETALEALRASQTGHLVLSTLHANDAVDAVQRLFDLGMHPNSIAAELLAVFSQRLVKRLCGACSAPDTPAPALLEAVFPEGAPKTFVPRHGAGCPRCSDRGTRGRTAVAEYLPSTRELREAIAHRRPLDELRATARAGEMLTLREHALELVREGVIGQDALRRILAWEGILL